MKVPISTDERKAFLSFLKTGTLGPIRVGMNWEEVRYILGPPTKFGNFTGIEQSYEIYQYGRWLERAFNEDVLEHLSLRYKWQSVYQRRLRLPGVFASPWTHRVASWSFLRFRAFLHVNGILFRLKEEEDGSLAIELSQGGGIIFDHRRGMGLHSINFVMGEFTFQFKDAKSCSPPRLLDWLRNRKL